MSVDGSVRKLPERVRNVDALNTGTIGDGRSSARLASAGTDVVARFEKGRPRMSMDIEATAGTSAVTRAVEPIHATSTEKEPSDDSEYDDGE